LINLSHRTKHNLNWMNSRFLIIIFALLLTSCTKEFYNPYDSATAPDLWMPKSFDYKVVGTNSIQLSWYQDEQHIDGFVVQKNTNGVLKEFLLPRDSIRFTDFNAVESEINDTCPQITYKVMARAGKNRSLDIGNAQGIFMPLSTLADAGLDVSFSDSTNTIRLNAGAPVNGESGSWSVVLGIGGSFSNSNLHNSFFTGLHCNNYTLRWTKKGCSESYDEMSVSFQQIVSSNANAGSNQIINDTTCQVLLNAIPAAPGETGTWSIVSNNQGSFSDINSPNAVFRGSPCSTYSLKWTVGVCGFTSDNVSISFQHISSLANAGADQVLASGQLQANLQANAPGIGEIGEWIVVSGNGGSFSNATSATSSFSGIAGTTYVLRWTLTGLCTSNADYVSISFQ
jgi:hypothetical protein